MGVRGGNFDRFSNDFGVASFCQEHESFATELSIPRYKEQTWRTVFHYVAETSIEVVALALRKERANAIEVARRSVDLSYVVPQAVDSRATACFDLENGDIVLPGARNNSVLPSLPVELQLAEVDRCQRIGPDSPKREMRVKSKVLRMEASSCSVRPLVDSSQVAV
jgi:hypothetical protein